MPSSTGSTKCSAQQHRQHHQPPERGRHVDAQPPAGQAGRAQAGLGGGNLFQRGRTRSVIGLAIGGQRDAPRGAMEQAHAQPRFQPGDGLAHGRARDAQRIGGLGETARAGRGDERDQAIQGFQRQHLQSLIRDK
ncbi:hypothetical protein G6F50_016207 [Rhizopus delemar]|uniref:Uncharacterized protein n=1 Tax=Rhizopus delemar TaxID=936053 RepID=A0A9P7C2J5_9FUNG|nr:hypothetical protein G6F50_016207 [Rhizopus delemar]